MKTLKSILSAIGILIIIIIVGIKIFHYFVSKKEEIALQKIQKAIQNQRMFYVMKLKEGYKALQEGNYTKAKLLFEDICKNAELYEIPEGCFNLGIMYSNGFGVDKNFTKAKQYLKKAADIGFVDAYGTLSVNALQKGDFKEALHYAKTGCELNSAYSCFMAGAFYYDGNIVERNLTAAKKYWKETLNLLPEARVPITQKAKEELKKKLCNAIPNLCDSNLTKGQ